MAYLNTPTDEVSREEIFANEGNYHHWNYESVEPVSTGYEEDLPEIHKYTKEMYDSLGDGTGRKTPAQQEMIEKVRAIYRRKNILPINYYSQLGVQQEIRRCIDYEAKFDGDTVNTGAGVGTGMCNFFFPNLFDTASIQDEDKKKEGADTLYGKFMNDKYLDRAIQFCFGYKDGDAVPSYVMGGLRLVGSAPSNFRPMNAQAIFERFCPENGVIFDTSSGFSGRLVGALTSKKNFTYVGTDPNMESMYNTHRIAEAIESVTGRTGSYELHCCGSELDDLIERESWADFHFSSPPYFELEDYGEHDANRANQSHVKFSGLESWLEGYVRGTCRNIYKALKGGAFSAVNIADFNMKGRGMISFVDEWKRIAEEEGLEYFTNIYLGVTARAGSLEQEMGVAKKEIIMVFKSTKPLWG